MPLIFQGSIKPEPKLNQSLLKPNESREELALSDLEVVLKSPDKGISLK